MRVTRRKARRILRNLTRYPKVAPLLQPERVECNVCGWKGREFLSKFWHRNTICPMCKSDVRHRLLLSAFTLLERHSFESLVEGKRVLHFAPELDIEIKIASLASEYIAADFLRSQCDWKLDISNMVSVDDEAFDLIIACDVLEHVPNDIRAMHEIFRVLSRSGCAVLTVPQKDNAAETYEDPQITSPEGRERAFGQKDHLRIYGSDFPGKLSEAGFRVTIVSEMDFAPPIVQRYVLFPPELSSKPLATNHRKVFFAFKDGSAAGRANRSAASQGTPIIKFHSPGSGEPARSSTADTNHHRRMAA